MNVEERLDNLEESDRVYRLSDISRFVSLLRELADRLESQIGPTKSINESDNIALIDEDDMETACNLLLSNIYSIKANSQKYNKKIE